MEEERRTRLRACVQMLHTSLDALEVTRAALLRDGWLAEVQMLEVALGALEDVWSALEIARVEDRLPPAPGAPGARA
jgi:hypothetical protein